MVTIEYLDDERTKLWAQVNELKAALGSAVEKLTTSDQSASAAVDKSLTELKEAIDAVKSIADAKTPEDVQTARRAAQEAVKIKVMWQSLGYGGVASERRSRPLTAESKCIMGYLI